MHAPSLTRAVDTALIRPPHLASPAVDLERLENGGRQPAHIHGEHALPLKLVEQNFM